MSSLRNADLWLVDTTMWLWEPISDLLFDLLTVTRMRNEKHMAALLTFDRSNQSDIQTIYFVHKQVIIKHVTGKVQIRQYIHRKAKVQIRQYIHRKATKA